MPPGVNIPGQACWDALDVPTQAKLIAYQQTCEHTELEEKIALAGGGKSSKPKTKMPRRKRR